MSNVGNKSCALLWDAKREKYLHEIPMFTFRLRKNIFKALPNLGTQIICAQNQCTAVKMTQKYPNIYVIPKYIYVCIYKYVCMYIYICMHAYIYVCTFTYVCTYIVYIYIDR